MTSLSIQSANEVQSQINEEVESSGGFPSINETTKLGLVKLLQNVIQAIQGGQINDLADVGLAVFAIKSVVLSDSGIPFDAIDQIGWDPETALTEAELLGVNPGEYVEKFLSELLGVRWAFAIAPEKAVMNQLWHEYRNAGTQFLESLE